MLVRRTGGGGGADLRCLHHFRFDSAEFPLQIRLPGVDSDKAAGGLVVRGQDGGGRKRGRAVGATVQMAAVVEDDVCGAAPTREAVDFFCEATGDAPGGRLAPVGRHGVPEDGKQAQFPGGLQDGGAAGAKGRTKVADRPAGDLLKAFTGVAELLVNAGAGREGEVGVVPRVVADKMAGGDDAAHEVWRSMGMAAEQEKGGADIVRGEQFEKAGGPGGVWAVVEGEGQLAGPGWGDQRGAEESRARPQSGVDATARSQAGPGDTHAGKQSER